MSILAHFIRLEFKGYRLITYLSILILVALTTMLTVSGRVGGGIASRAMLLREVVTSNISIYYPLAALIAFYNIGISEKEKRWLELAVSQPISKPLLLLKMTFARYVVFLPASLITYSLLLEFSGLRLGLDYWRYYSSILLTALHVSCWVGLIVLIAVGTGDSRKSLAYSLTLWSLLSLPYVPQALGYVLACSYISISGGDMNVYLLEHYSNLFQNIVPSRAYYNCMASLYDTPPGMNILRYGSVGEWLLGGVPSYMPIPNILLIIYMVDFAIITMGIASILFEKWNF